MMCLCLTCKLRNLNDNNRFDRKVVTYLTKYANKFLYHQEPIKTRAPINRMQLALYSEMLQELNSVQQIRSETINNLIGMTKEAAKDRARRWIHLEADDDLHCGYDEIPQETIDRTIRIIEEFPTDPYHVGHGRSGDAEIDYRNGAFEVEIFVDPDEEAVMLLIENRGEKYDISEVPYDKDVALEFLKINYTDGQ